MFSINTNVGALAALAALSQTQQDLTTTQNHVSTGKKVSSASDNPAIYSISQTMNAQLSGLSAVSDNLNFGQSVVGVAQSATTNISSQLASLKNTVTQGQQSGISNATINNQINAILTNIDAFAQSATFNGVNLISGGTGAGVTSQILNTTENTAGTLITVNNQNTTVTGLGLTGLAVNSSAVQISFDNTAAPAANDSIDLVDASGNHTTFYLSDGTTAPSAPATPTSSTQKNLYVTFATTDNMATVLSKVATEMQKAGFGAAVDSTGALVVAGATSSTTTLASGGATDGTITGATAAISIVDSAISSLNTKVAALGAASQQISGMQNFAASLTQSLTTGLGALTDADMAAESARLQSLQTKQSLGIQSLSIANQQPQSLLSLFRG